MMRTKLTRGKRLFNRLARQAFALFQEPPSDDQEFELITYGLGGRFTDVDIDKTCRLLAQDDIDRFTAAP